MKTNKQNTSNVPNLRFHEFTDEWEVKKLGEVVKINQGLQIAISERFTENEVGTCFYITNEFLKANSEKKYYILNPPLSVICTEKDILMTRTGNTGQVVTNVSGAFHNNFFKVAYPEYINKNFLYNFLKLNKIQNQIVRLAGTSTIPDLNHSDFYRIKILFPSFQEQQKIASFLSLIDGRISTQIKIIEALKEFKSSLSKQIFSRKLRFKDENGDDFLEWEETKLGEFVELYKGSSLSKGDILEEGQFKCIHYGELFTVYHEVINKVFSRTNKNGFQSKIGDVLMPSSDVTPLGLATASAILEDGVILGGDINVLRSQRECNPILLSYLLNHEKKKIIELVSGTTIKHIYGKDLKNINLCIPISQDEQQKIASILSAIDKKIEIEKRILEEYTAQKKYLLKQMFI